ncbi:MAG: c-type cytochrome, partial [Planctomycetales bacterium]
MTHQRRSLPVSAATAMFFVLAPVALCGEGVVAGWDSNDGRVLLGELKCAACHDAGSAANVLSEKQAPILSHVGARATPQYLKAFLSNPHAVKSGATMPDAMHGLPQDQRAKAADVLTHYLVSLGGPLDQRASGASLTEIARGRELFHTVGCVACHQPLDPPPKHKIDPATAAANEDAAANKGNAAVKTKTKRPSVPLPPLAMKTTVDELARFLHDPLLVRPSGRMPSMSLQPGEGRSLAAYLLREQYTADQTAPGSG